LHHATDRLYSNQLPTELAHELAEARSVGIVPIRVDDAEFAGIANAGTTKWAVIENRELLIVPKYVDTIEIKHTELSNGNPVWAAGEADIAITNNRMFGIEINHYSGHYRPNIESLEIGRAAFAAYGIEFP